MPQVFRGWMSLPSLNHVKSTKGNTDLALAPTSGLVFFIHHWIPHGKDTAQYAGWNVLIELLMTDAGTSINYNVIL